MKLVEYLLGPAQPSIWRVRTTMTLSTLGLYLLFAALQMLQVRQGWIEAFYSDGLILYYVGGSLVFYGLVRTRVSERLSHDDPSLTLWQSLHAIVAVICAYAITGPARGALLGVLVLILTYAMFSLSVIQAWLLALFSLVGLGWAMAWKSLGDPVRYPWGIEGVHLAFTIIVLLGIAALAVRMGSLRQRLHRHKTELEASLEQIRLLATHDDLTGLINRRYMGELLRAQQTLQQRHGQVMTIALLDLDRFKHVNDSFGHQVGDKVLCAFVAGLRPGLRSSDVLSRWGGEEFMLLLPQTRPEESLLVVDRLREMLAGVDLAEMAPGWTLTFSAGLAACEPGDAIERTIERADQALYRAKQSGRSRSCCA